MPRNPKPCKICSELGHTQFYCRQKKRKRIDPRGKQYYKWQETRAKYLKANSQKMFVCYLCNKSIPKEQVTIDHVAARSSNPKLRHVESNLKPCCWQCNGAKGSKSYEAYLRTRRIGNVSGKSSMQ